MFTFPVTFNQTAAAGTAPVWESDYATDKSLTPGVGTGTPTCTRSGATATYFDSSGDLQTASANVARFTHRYVENLFSGSEQMDGSTNGWGKDSRASITENDAVAPDGTTTAERVYRNSLTGSAQIRVYKNGFTLPAAGEYTISAYAAADDLDFAHIDTQVFGAGADGESIFDLVNGTVTTEHANHTARIEPASASYPNAPDGWWRISVTADFSAADLVGLLGYGPALNGTTLSLDPNAGGIHVWGAQLRRGSDPGEYVPTTTAAASTWESVGLQVEEERANDWLDNRDPSAGSWSNNTVTLTQDQTGIDGVTSSAWTIDDASSGTAGYARQSRTVADDSNEHQISAFFEKTSGASNYSALYTFVEGGTSVISGWILNTNTGALTAHASNAGSSSALVEDCGDYWRVTAQLTNNSTGNTTLEARLYPAANTDGSSSISAATTGSKGYDWGQIEIDAGAPSSPIGETGGSVVTRKKDDIQIATGSMTGVDFTNVAILVEYDGDGGNTILSVDNGTANERIYLAGGTLNVVDGGSSQAAISGGTETAGLNRVAFRVAANDFAISLNGATVVTDTSGTLPTVDTFHIGQDYQEANQANTTIRRIVIYDGADVDNDGLETLASGGSL